MQQPSSAHKNNVSITACKKTFSLEFSYVFNNHQKAIQIKYPFYR